MKQTVITILLSLFFMTGRGQGHYRLEGTVGDSTLNTRLLLWQTMSDMHVVNQVVDTVDVIEGKLHSWKWHHKAGHELAGGQYRLSHAIGYTAQ